MGLESYVEAPKPSVYGNETSGIIWIQVPGAIRGHLSFSRT